ncbi:MAG: hypothetical protein LBH96_03625 [Candidatus Peribacteria bacterium]|nr:hypothetical protein [Candidatus Peribacteria bacterium]
MQDFVSGNAQNIYRNRLYIPQENKSVTFEKQPFIVPESYGTDDTEVVPFMAKKELAWSIKE